MGNVGSVDLGNEGCGGGASTPGTAERLKITAVKPILTRPTGYDDSTGPTWTFIRIDTDEVFSLASQDPYFAAW